MTFKIILTRSAERELFKLQKSEIKKISKSIDSLQTNPRPKGYIKLRGPENFYRIRIGNYRIIYSIDDTNKLVEILIIRDRKEAYK